MKEIKLNIDEIRKFSKQVKSNISNLHYNSIEDFEKSNLNKLIVKQLMNSVALGQDEVIVGFLSLDPITQKIIARYYQKLGFEAQFINVENKNTIVFEGLENLNSSEEYKREIIKQSIGKEAFEALTDEEYESLSEDVEKIMKKVTSSIPETEMKLELRISWDGTFYSAHHSFSNMEGFVSFLDGIVDDETLEKLERLTDFLNEDFDDYSDDEDEDEDEDKDF